ncbi:MAG: aspartate-semialdehyde dehydrogenase [Deltaproteobacteria bacterium]|nr:aspartate-semialdehyde dehydrogenase [Deltaproteobacteria bacterium]
MHVAVVGATGVVGRETLSILHERRFPMASLTAFASERSAGESIDLGDLDVRGEGKSLEVQSIEKADFKGIDIVFFAASGGISKTWAPRAAEAGAVCIDKSSSFRMDDDVPLVVPEVNGAALKGFTKKRIIATPNCSTIQLVQLLAPLQRAVGIERVVVCTYQAVSGAGRGGVDELEAQTRDMFNFKDLEPKVFDQQIAFNVLPRIPARDPIPKDGTTGEERKMIEETRKILGIPGLRVGVTCVRVPVFNAHSEAVHVELKAPLTAEQAKTLFALEPNVLVVDDVAAGIYPTALDATGEDKTLVGRIRTDESVPDGRGLAFWVVSDNLRTGAALNAVRIAEALCADFL